MKEPWQLFPYWMPNHQTRYWRELLIDRIPWEQPTVSVFGANHVVPRKTAFLADKGLKYRYSGFEHFGLGWPNWFEPLHSMVNNFASNRFNGCLVNLYRNGSDRMGWHSDNESVLDNSKPIVSLSFGASRDFIFKNKKNKLKKKLILKDGDLLIMQPTCQQNWVHSLPSRSNILKSRINLTFRVYKNQFKSLR